MNYKRLNKNIKKIWLIYYCIISVFILSFLLLIKLYFFNYIQNYYNVYSYFILIVLISCICMILIIPNINYMRYKYIIQKNRIEIVKGFFFIKTIIIPLDKVQYIIKRQNPFNKIFNLQDIKIFTTSKSYGIEGLTENEIIEINTYLHKYLTK